MKPFACVQCTSSTKAAVNFFELREVPERVMSTTTTLQALQVVTMHSFKIPPALWIPLWHGPSTEIKLKDMVKILHQFKLPIYRLPEKLSRLYFPFEMNTWSHMVCKTLAYIGKLNPCTLPCQIRTARCLLGPVMKCTHVGFCRPCFLLLAPCGFYSDRVFLLLHHEILK